MPTMKALMKDGNAVAVKVVPQPRAQTEDEVLIRVVLAGLCRTDMYVAEGRIASPDPLLLGHEFAGGVAEVGAQITDLKPGDRVAVNPALPCEKCQFCVRGATADCQHTSFLGVDRHGAFAEFVVVPARVVYRLPDTVSFLAGAYLEPVAASLAVLKADIQPEAKGLIYGDNRISRLTHKLLSAHGFHQVAVYDARSHPHALEPNTYDYIIETLATTEALQHMVHALRPRGTIVLKSRQYQPVSFTLSEIMKKEPVFRVVNYGSFQESLALLATGRLTVDDLAGRLYPLEDYRAVFADAQHSEALKPFFALSEVDGVGM
jgi:threonine dehydrogenase-like Zn-dependent dehydrogenase